MGKKSRFWFPAKRYGWGWGPPVCWQGWAVLLGYFALMLAVDAIVHEENPHDRLIAPVTAGVEDSPVVVIFGDPVKAGQELLVLGPAEERGQRLAADGQRRQARLEPAACGQAAGNQSLHLPYVSTASQSGKSLRRQFAPD